MIWPFNLLINDSLSCYYVSGDERTLITSSNLNSFKHKLKDGEGGEFRDDQGNLSVVPLLGMFWKRENGHDNYAFDLKLAFKLIKNNGYPTPKITDFSSKTFWELSAQHDYYLNEIKFILKQIDPYLNNAQFRGALMSTGNFFTNFPVIFQHLKENEIDVRVVKGVEGAINFIDDVLNRNFLDISEKKDFFKYFYEKQQIVFDHNLEDTLLRHTNLLIELKDYQEVHDIIYKAHPDFLNLTNLQSLILNKKTADVFSELAQPSDLKIAYNDLLARGLLEHAENFRAKFSLGDSILDINLVYERMYHNFRSLVELKKFPALAQLIKRHNLLINDLKDFISNEFEYKADFNKYFTQFSPSDFKEVFIKMMSLAQTEIVTKLSDGKCNPKLEWLIGKLFEKSLTHQFDTKLLNLIKQVAPNPKMITSFENEQDVMNLTLGRVLQKFNEEFSYEVMALHGHAPASNFKHNQLAFRGIKANKDDLTIFNEFKKAEQPYANFKTATKDSANNISIFSKVHNSGQSSTVPNYFIGKPFENSLEWYSKDEKYPFTTSDVNLEEMQQGGIYISLSEKGSARFAGGQLTEYVMPKNELTMCGHSFLEVEMVPSVIKHENIRAIYFVKKTSGSFYLGSIEIVKVLSNPNFYVKGETLITTRKIGDIIEIQESFQRHEDIMRTHMDQYKCHEFSQRFKGFDDFYDKFGLQNLEAEREKMYELLKDSDAYQSICESNSEYL